MDDKELVARYFPGSGLGNVAGHIAKTMGVQALSGIKGLSALPQGMDAAADAVNKYQSDNAPEDPSPEGIAFIRSVVGPAYNGVANSPVGHAAHALSQAYGEGSQHLSDLAGKYLGAGAAGAVGAVADAAPMAITPEGILGKGAADAAKLVPAYVKAKVGEHIIAMDPQTGEHVAHVTTGMGDGVVHHLESAGHPEVEKDLIRDAIADAHENGLPYHVPTATLSMADIPGGEPTPGGGLVFPKQVAADDAEVGETPHFDPNGFAGGGGVMEEIARLAKQYAPVMKSIEETGGASYHPGTGNMPSSGYAVSLHKGRESVLPAPPTPSDLHNYIQANQDAFQSDPGAHLGVWKNPKTGQTYLDVSHVDPDFGSAVKKAQANNQLAIFDLANKEDIPTTPESMHFVHYGNVDQPQMTLDPAFYGTGIKGAEATRGGPPATSLYPADIAKPEPGLEGKAKYRVTVPTSQMYDMSADPAGYRADGDYTAAEQAIKDAGYAGYHTPTHGNPIMQGQARMLQPTPAVRLSPAGAPGPAKGKGPSPAVPQSGIYDDTADTSDFADGGHVARFADAGGVGGAELSAGLDDIGALVAKYATHDVAPANQAQHVADTVAKAGSATYNPTTGDMHTSGYAVPHEVNRSVSLDTPPTAGDIHDFMVANQDAFDNPKAAIHVESNGPGQHFMHVAHVEPDFDSALAAAKEFDAPGVRELHTGVNLPTDSSTPISIGQPESDPGVEDYLAGSKIPAANSPAELDQERNARPATAWQHGKPTVDPAQRVAFPGIYNDPRQVIEDANAKVGPEDPLLHQLFGVHRQDLSDIAQSRQGNVLGVLPGAKQNGTGAASARAVMTPRNEQRLIDVLSEARGTPLHTGMTGWYTMDPLYQHFLAEYGEEEGPQRYEMLNTLMGMASPGSNVSTEIARGTSANWLNNQGRFNDFMKYAGMAEDRRGGERYFPEDMLGVPGHAYHPTAQAGPMDAYLRSGAIQMKSPKVPMYIGASGVPDIGFQSDMPVGDAHWARGVGLADTRNWTSSKGKQTVPGASVSTPEMQTLGPWWRDRVAAQAGYQAVPAQATAWGAFAPYTGVDSAIGAPKLEMFSTQIGKLASRLGVAPEDALSLVVRGQAGAY